MQFEGVAEGVRSQVARLRCGLLAAWVWDVKPPTAILITLKHALMFPAIRGWDELAMSKCCILYQDIKAWDFLLDLFTEGIDRRIACKVDEKEFNIVKLRRFLYLYRNAWAPVSLPDEQVKNTFDGLVAPGLAPTRNYQPFGIHGSKVLGGFEAESDICPSNQHNFAGEVFGHEGYGARPLFEQELEEGSLGHRVLFV